MQTLSIGQVAAAPLTEGKAIKKLSDGAGLFLQIDARSKAWRFRYKFADKDALLSLGVYPAVSLAQARAKAAECRVKLERGENPSAARHAARAQEATAAEKTFGIVALEYNDTRTSAAPKTQQRCDLMFRHSKKLHGRRFDQIEFLELLSRCELGAGNGNRETADRLGVYFSQVYRYARAKGYYKGADPIPREGFGKSITVLVGERPEEEHEPGLTDPRAVGGLMRVLDGNEWVGMLTPTVSNALQIMARTVVRAGELRSAEWPDIDLTGKRHEGNPTWAIPRAKMKMREQTRVNYHIVPLSRQAVEILKAQQALTGHGKFVFPGERTDARPLSDGTLSAALIRLGYRGQHVPHGFRTTFATLARDTLKAESELVERQLAHKVGNEVAGAYDRSQRLEERRALMQAYSDLLDKLRDG